jgi:ribosomal protein L11 methyltransferase
VIRLAVRVQRAHAELVLAELLELSPAGVEESQIGEDAVEYAVYGAPGELPALPALEAAAGDALVEISTSETADDWQDRWKQFHQPVLVRASADAMAAGRPVPALRVRPPWEPAGTAPADPHGVEEIVIDPGQAFGTGGHATTRLCLEMLLHLAASGLGDGPLLDVGTGSGVLAIAASRLGFAPVLALDHDRLSINAARVNAAVNGASCELRRLDLRTQQLPWLGAQDTPGAVVLTANLLRPLLLDLAQRIVQPSHMIAGGLLRGQVDEVARAICGRLGMHERERSFQGDWAAVWLQAGEAAPVAARSPAELSAQPAEGVASGSSVAARTIER